MLARERDFKKKKMEEKACSHNRAWVERANSCRSSTKDCRNNAQREVECAECVCMLQ